MFSPLVSPIYPPLVLIQADWAFQESVLLWKKGLLSAAKGTVNALVVDRLRGIVGIDAAEK
jgi:hypothetical protein